MTSLRRQQLAAFRQDILAGKRQSHDVLFRARYGIPADVQIELARFMTARYLPIFRSHRTDLPWVEQVLEGVDAYFGPTGRGFPEPTPMDLLHGDGNFMVSVFGLAHAWQHAHRNEQGPLTATCGAILGNAVAAREANVWRADDPDAVHAFDIDDREALYGREAYYNVASQAVRRREWLVITDWLDEHDVGEFPDIPEADQADCEKWLAWWTDREYVL